MGNLFEMTYYISNVYYFTYLNKRRMDLASRKRKGMNYEGTKVLYILKLGKAGSMHTKATMFLPISYYKFWSGVL
jgi:hypothetical protein